MLCSFCNKDLLFETKCHLCEKKACINCRSVHMSVRRKAYRCNFHCSSPIISHREVRPHVCVYCDGIGWDWQNTASGDLQCKYCKGKGEIYPSRPSLKQIIEPPLSLIVT